MGADFAYPIMKKLKDDDMYGFAASDNNRLTIRIPDRKILRVIARSVLLFIIITSFPWIGSILGSSDASVARPPIDDLIFLPMLFQDLANVGLLNSGDRAVLIGQADPQRVQILKEIEVDLVPETDTQRLGSILDNSLDFVFTSGFAAAEFIDRTLKIGGIVAVRISGDPSDAFRVPLNFRIVYLRQFDATVVAMRKIGRADGAAMKPPTRRRLLAVESNKRAALKGLEDVLLEPPRAASMQSRRLLRRTKYLPDLMDDSLDRYPRRVFIDVESPGRSGGTGWFQRHYPTRKRKFEIYMVEAVASEASAEVGMSEWLRSNVKEDEYVVMKAEAEVVEEMVTSKAIFLVDELFMECKHEGQKGGKNPRAYWECLAIYGKLRDEGVAVHQWWG